MQEREIAIWCQGELTRLAQMVFDRQNFFFPFLASCNYEQKKEGKIKIMVLFLLEMAPPVGSSQLACFAAVL